MCSSIMESFRLETFTVIKSNHKPNTSSQQTGVYVLDIPREFAEKEVSAGKEEWA